MGIPIITALLLTISCCLWIAEGRRYSQEITVKNGGPWGNWGKSEFCPNGYAVGFSLKVMKERTRVDNSALNGIRLNCSDGNIVQSLEYQYGTWTKFKSCPSGYLVSFSLRVQTYLGKLDDVAATNIMFKCSNDARLDGDGVNSFGMYGKWSDACGYGIKKSRSYICGIQTKVETEDGFWFDNTALNDVKFFCCIMPKSS